MRFGFAFRLGRKGGYTWSLPIVTLSSPGPNSHPQGAVSSPSLLPCWASKIRVAWLSWALEGVESMTHAHAPFPLPSPSPTSYSLPSIPTSSNSSPQLSPFRHLSTSSAYARRGLALHGMGGFKFEDGWGRGAIGWGCLRGERLVWRRGERRGGERGEEGREERSPSER
jgi:hypothetical protein